MAGGSGNFTNDSFDENFLFSEFEEPKSKSKPRKFSQTIDAERDSDSWTIEELKAENHRLKTQLATLLFPSKCSIESRPVVQAVFFENKESILNQCRLEELISSISNSGINGHENIDTEGGNEDTTIGFTSVQPSLETLNGIFDDVANSDTDRSTTIVSCVRYYEFFCVDCCGLPLKELDSRISVGWDIPRYEQIYFVALPFEEESKNKIRVSRKKTCFNCGSREHNLSNCPEPHNPAQIESQRKKFLNKFTSPIVKGSRYHVNEKRFGDFKPGVISDTLREALGIGQDEVPPYVYKMRCLGYPPGYLPKSRKPSLLLYDATGNVDDYIMEDDEEEEEEESQDKKELIEYPGFNCPLPEGVEDRSHMIGFPPMNPHHQIAEMEWWYKQLPSPSRSKDAKRRERKRKLVETQLGASDMDVDEEGIAPVPFELGTPPESPHGISRKRARYDDIDSGDNEGGYSPCHPGLQIGDEEKKLLQRIHHVKKHPPPLPSEPFYSSTPPPLPTEGHPPGGSTSSRSSKGIKARRKSDGSKEEGELTDDSDGEMYEEEYEEYDSQEEHDGQEEEEIVEDKGYRDWWIEVPLTPQGKSSRKLSPPPLPAVKLPLDLLTRFYTSSTVLQKVSFEDRVMWLDPIYGNIQVSSGRYDKLKEILQKKKIKKRK